MTFASFDSIMLSASYVRCQREFRDGGGIVILSPSLNSSYTLRAGGDMSRVLTIVIMFVAVASLSAADLDPKAINIQLPKDIKWVANPAAGAETAVLVGDPNKPGLY